MGEPLAIPLLRAAIFSNNGGREKANKQMLWGQTEVSFRFLCGTSLAAMPDWFTATGCEFLKKPRIKSIAREG
ncbi:hypothetical protein [Agrobacterium fabrum]|uniref:hypothetical protein n=1 Tax=Agrobacterium fabrum TaxID=1176649 RepID=UPI0013A6C51F|nr:hypothetical protein [Agrobacterium fabrum]MCR6726753.1 hypothetical protein [Agrobacterium fabrum]NTB10104.1 hypothetical protein [Agrobacterium fabrum]UXT60168.1 hypothetical protein FY134_21160 [Agrobacterium fabrum]WCK78237.1 hypothetical protein G6L39_016245 [Agrobacterium fabrum]WIE29281.1 hypothetical protein G6L42_015850 [Agrobacterium fabrum]